MRLLVIGGTLFLGRHIVDAALARGDTVTLMNRGRTRADLFPGVDRVIADRDGGMDALGDRRFDAVIDTCGYVPRVVEQSAAWLAGRCDFYLFVSTLSVYAGIAAGEDEDAPLARLEAAELDREDVQAHYGPLKVQCEQVVEAHFPGRAQHARAGFIVGPYDRIERFPYWVRRLGQGGPTLAPGTPETPLQWIDARDLARWLVDSAAQGRGGRYNLTGPEKPRPIGDVLAAMIAALGSDARLVWPGDAFLAAHGVAPLDGLPLWIPAAYAGFCQRGIDRALAAGLTFLPVEDSARDTRDAMLREGFTTDSKPGVQIACGMNPAREAELLALLAREPQPGG